MQLYGGCVEETLVSELNEDELIARFAPKLPQAGALVPTGDDAAVLELSDPRLAVTTDALVEGVHFRNEWSSGADVGWRAIMQNAPDVAAMGGVPHGFVVSLVMPPSLKVAWVLDFADGMADACRAITAATGKPCGVVGGDLAGGPHLMISVAAFGEVLGAPVLRSGAKPGDVVAHAGSLGRSAAGLALLQAGQSPAAGTAAEVAIQTYLRPEPPLPMALAAAASGAHAMMDVSDGLVRDSQRMAKASGVAIELDADLTDPVVSAVASQIDLDSNAWVYAGGEDHGFLATFPPGEIPAGFAKIGRVTAGSGVTVGGEVPKLSGWDHFRPKAG